MMRALYAAVSGLQAHQVKMDVLANNIANVNTIGFKKGQVTFQDILSQTLNDAQAGTTASGGINAQQIGSGVRLGAINNIQTQGAPSATGNSTDVMIQGEGYFILTDGAATPNICYTRAGSFSLDNNGNMVDSTNGMKVCDKSGTAINIKGSNLTIAANGTISYIDATTNLAAATCPQIGLATFANPEGLKKVGENMYIASAASGTANTPTAPGTNSGTLIAGSLEMSNVDLAQEFVDMIVAERGYQANAKTIHTADEILQELINLKR
jgi:flagellar hook protein FlgE